LELREGAWRVTIGSFGQAGGRADDVIALLRADPDGADSFPRHCERSDEAIQQLAILPKLWIASRSLSSGAHFARPVGSQ
jgi:hypothetical protein